MIVRHLNLLTTLAGILITFSATAQSVEDFVNTLMERYPESRLIDIYKSCFHDFMGAGHMITDTAAVREYLTFEIAAAAADTIRPDVYYEPCGIRGSHVRVNLRAVNDGVISADRLFQAFLESGDVAKTADVTKWKKEWERIQREIDKMRLNLPHYADDRKFINSLLKEGKYAVSHSQDYREAYHPHYRIVKRELLSKLTEK